MIEIVNDAVLYNNHLQLQVVAFAKCDTCAYALVKYVTYCRIKFSIATVIKPAIMFRSCCIFPDGCSALKTISTQSFADSTNQDNVNKK